MVLAGQMEVSVSRRSTALLKKLILDTGKGCSVCGDTPVVNLPGGSGTYWLCGGCVGEKLDTARRVYNLLLDGEAEKAYELAYVS